MTKISIALQTDKELQAYGKLAHQVEGYGFDRITVYNDLLYQPAWPALFEIAAATSSIELGVAAVNPFTSHPINIAANIALLQEKSQGRAYLGIARGAWLDFLNIDHPRPLTAVQESFQLVRHLLAGQTEAFDGSVFSTQGGARFRWELPYRQVPMLLGSWGLQTLKRCYPYIQEVKLGGSANPAMCRYFIEQAEQIREELKQSHRIGVVMGAVCVVDQDGKRAKQLAKQEVALYLPVIADLDPTLDIDQQTRESIKQAADQFDYQQAAAYITDSMLENFAFAGTPEEITRQCITLIDAGAACIELGTPHGLETKLGLQLLGEEVLPELQNYIATEEEEQ